MRDDNETDWKRKKRTKKISSTEAVCVALSEFHRKNKWWWHGWYGWGLWWYNDSKSKAVVKEAAAMTQVSGKRVVQSQVAVSG